MYLHALNGALGALEGSGPAGDGSLDLAPGPEYPRITENPDGTRRIEYWPGQVATSVEVLDVGRRVGDMPRHFPGRAPGSGWWYPTPGQARTYPASRELTPTDVIMLPRRVRPDVLSFAKHYVGGPTEEDAQSAIGPDRTLPCFYDAFRFKTIIDGSGRFVIVQAPTHGWPDQVPTYPDGTPNPYRTYAGRGGYAHGTPDDPYRPWMDPDNALYGHCVDFNGTERALPPRPPGPIEEPPPPAQPRLPPTHDPWEPTPPVVDGPWQPDPEDPGGPLVPLEPPPTGDPGAPPEPVPCYDAANDWTGFVDPATGDCVPSGGPAQPPPPGAGDPGVPGGGFPPPTGDPWGPPPGLPPGGGGTQDPNGGGGFPPPGAPGALWPLGALLALLLLRKR